MANLSVIFSMVDNISQKLSSMGQELGSVADSFRDIEDEADSAFGSVSSGMDETEKAMERFASQMQESMADAFEQVVSDAGLSEDQIEDVMGELPDFFRGVGDGIEDEMKAVSDAADGTGDSLEELGSEFQEAGEAGQRSGSEMEGAMRSLESFLASAGIVAGVKKIIDVLGECAAEAEKVETAFAKLETIAGAAPMDSLKEQIMELSNATGIAAEDLAEVAYNAISAGTAVDQSVEMAAMASKLAIAGFTDTNSALKMLTGTMNAYGESAGTAAEIADSLIMVQNLGVTTVAELSSSMGKAIATGAAYNVTMDNLESAYISLTKNNIQAAEATTYMSSMLKELGSDGTDVAKILEEETGQSFAQLMKSGYSLADVLGVLYDSCNNDATALMNLWSSAEAGKASNAILMQGLNQFNENLDALHSNIGITEEAFETMASTTEFAHNRMVNSAKNLKVSIGNALNPMLEGLYNLMTPILNGLAWLNNTFPVITHLLTAGAAAVGVLAVAVAGYTVVKKLATAAEAAHAAMIETTTGAMTLQLGVIGAIAVAAGVLIAAWASSRKEEEELTASSEELNNQLTDLNSEYEQTVQAFGETSAEAQMLKGEIEELDGQFQASKMTLTEFYDHLDKVCDESNKICDAFDSMREEAEKNKASTDALIGKLRELSTSSVKSVDSQAKMESIVRRLNQLYPELNLSIDDVNGNLDLMAAKIDAVNGATMQAEYDAAMDTWAKATEKQNEVLEVQQEAYKNLLKAQKDYANQNIFEGTWNEFGNLSGPAKALKEAEEAYDKATEAVNRNAETIAESERIIGQYADVVSGASDQTVDAWDAVSIAISENEETVKKLSEEYQKAYESAISSIRGQWALWDEVGDGVEGPWKLWDKVEKLQKVSLDAMQKNMEDQLTYWNTYQDNVDSLHERHIAGLDDMVAAINDGSTETAAYLAKMVNASDEELTRMVNSYQNLQNAQNVSLDDMRTGMQKQMQFWQEYADNLESLHSRNIDGLDELVASMNDGSEESAKYLALMSKASDEELSAMAKQYESLQMAQEQTADDMAELATNYDDRLAEIEASFAETVNAMNMEEEAYNAAVATLQGYINGIKSMQDAAASAAAAVAEAADRQLRKPGGTTVEGHAGGTLDSEPYYIAGEEGPELIISGGHDTVFPTSETEKLLNAVEQTYPDRLPFRSEDLDALERMKRDIWASYEPDNKAVTDQSNRNSGSYEAITTSNEKKEISLTIDVNGSGTVKVDGGAFDGEAVWESVKDRIKDQLIDTLQEEIYTGAGKRYVY